MQCPEPNGRERPLGPDDKRTAHDIMLDEAGHCPYCGQDARCGIADCPTCYPQEK